LWMALVLVVAGIVAVFLWTSMGRHKTARESAGGLMVFGRQTSATAPMTGTQAGSLDSLPTLGAVPAFSLVDQRGEPFGSSQLIGHPWVADFIFTRCAGQCLGMAARMQELQAQLSSESNVRLVSFSVDPEYDTPEVLSRYASEHSVQPGRWIFLTGDRSQIHRLSIDGFRLGIAEGNRSEAEPILHSTRLVLVDAEGRIRGYYDATEPPAVDRLLQDIGRLREQPGT